MKTPSIDDSIWVKRTKWLTQALILSGTLNIGLIASMTYFAVKKASFPKIMKSSSSKAKTSRFLSSSSVDVIWDYFHAPYATLIADLGNALLVEDGLSKRDFALAFLVEYHHFDLERALPATQLQVREVEIIHQDGGERVTLRVFPGLERDHFTAIESFAKTEKWPYTPEGLHAHLKGYDKVEGAPSSLKETIFLTQEFHTIWMLFNRFEKVLSMDALLQFFQKTDFSILTKFHRDATSSQDFSIERRREFLVELLKQHVQEAAEFFLQYDAEFALQKLDDASVLELIKHISHKTAHADEHLKQLLVSLRSDDVHEASAIKLYQLVGEEAPKQNSYKEALAKFCQHPLMKAETPKTVQEVSQGGVYAQADRRIHIVKQGETLWQIARDYHVDLQQLKKVNNLTTSPLIRPGMKLEIPKG